MVLAILLVAVAFVVHREYKEKRPQNAGGPLYKRMPMKPTLRFIAFGDSGDGKRPQMMVAKAMEKRCQEYATDGIIHVCDVFYQTGAESVDDPRWQSRVMKPYGGPCLGDVPIYSVFGNHDYSGNADAEIEYSRQNPRWVKPYRFYERTFGNLIQLVAFDSWLPDMCFDSQRCAIDFLRKVLDTPSDTRWRVVFGYYPMASASERSAGARGWLLRRLMCAENIDLYIAGHMHHLEYREIDGCMPTQVISGGGGGTLYDVNNADGLARFAESRFGFVELEVTRSRLTIRFFGIQGEELFLAEKT